MFPRCSLIVAVRQLVNGRFLIGQSNKLPWGFIERDMKMFQRLTMGNSIGGAKKNAIVMGSKTYASLPKKPLPGRMNWVLSHETGFSWEQVREKAREMNPPEIWVVGGAEIYNQCFRELPIRNMFVTFIENADDSQTPSDKLVVENGVFFEPDSSFVENLGRAKLVDESDIYYSQDELIRWKCQVRQYELPIHPEYQYLDQIHHIIQTGITKRDRTGVGTISNWGGMTRWNLRDGFPLLTTKKVFWKGVAEELLWFLQGRTDAKVLSQKGVRIWDANGSREFLDNLGLTHRREGDLGPVYGFQWRHFNGEYIDADTFSTEKPGVDQIRLTLDKLKKAPWDRRCLVVAWNPSALPDMALPPCHVLFQLQGVGSGTAEDPMRLNCLFYQRSCDMGLGVPFNIASYALLTHIFAHILGWEVGELVHLMGDTHVYTNHVEPLKEQLKRNPLEFPKLRILCEPKGDPAEYQYSDFKIDNYKSHATIPMEMAV